MSCDVTYEELAALAVGELPDERRAEVLAHVPACDRCGRRLAAIRRADAALTALRPERPPAGTVLAARRALADVLRPPRESEIMTLGEVAEFLRIASEQLDQVVEELPAFELGGQVRVRRAALLDWIRRRERDYARQTAGSWMAHVTSQRLEEGVMP